MRTEIDHLKRCQKYCLNNGVEDAIEDSEFNDILKKS